MPKKAKKTSGTPQRQVVGQLRLPMVELLKDLPWFEVDGRKEHWLPKFSGALQTPIVDSPSNYPIIDGVHHLDELTNNILRQRLSKLVLLMEYYKLENHDDPWLLLSLRLACSFVTGLRVFREMPRGRGRPRGAKKWTDRERSELVAAVEGIQSEKGKKRTIKQSIEILKKREPKRWPSLKAARYHEAKAYLALASLAT
jgi:hypothetical protein